MFPLMIVEQNIVKFLESFNPKDKVHSRVAQMLIESVDIKDVENMLDDLLDAQVNSINLRAIKDEMIENKKPNENLNEDVSFEINKRFNDKFASYLDFKENKFINSSASFNNFDFNNDCNHVKKIKINDDEESDKVLIPGLDVVEDENNLENFPYFMDNEILSEVTKVSPAGSSINENGLTPQSNLTVLNSDDNVFYSNILTTKSKIQNKENDPSYLYLILQCKLCGLRFNRNETDAFGLHIEDHRRKTKALSEKPILRREYFTSKKVNKVKKLELALDDSIEKLIFQKDSPNCAICHKIIKKQWDDEMEDWVLDKGVRINDVQYAHRDCVV